MLLRMRTRLKEARSMRTAETAFIKLDEGWEIAPGDDHDREVCLKHRWCSHALVFADGDFAPTSIRLSPLSSYGRQYRERMMKIMGSTYPRWQPFVVRQGAMVSATEDTYDVLLRLLA